jgi:hypothetical protein
MFEIWMLIAGGYRQPFGRLAELAKDRKPT